jgi:hypothetical protein
LISQTAAQPLSASVAGTNDQNAPERQSRGMVSPINQALPHSTQRAPMTFRDAVDVPVPKRPPLDVGEIRGQHDGLHWKELVCNTN